MTKPGLVCLLVALASACKAKEGAESRASRDAKVPVATDGGAPAPVDARPQAAVDAGGASQAERPAYRPGPEPLQTAETWEALYLALAACQLDGARVAAPCPEMQVLDEFDKAGSNSAGNEHWADNMRSQMAVATKLTTAEHPTVRVVAIALVHHLGGDTDSKVLVAGAIAREQDPVRRKALAIMLSGADYPVPQQIELMMQFAEDPDPEVRRVILYGLGDSEVPGTGANLPGAYEKVAEHLASDPDPEAREAACGALGALGDPRAVKVIDDVLVESTPTELYDACLEALIKLWAWPENAVRPAYQRTLALIPKIERPLDRLWAFRALTWQYDDEEEAKLHRFVKRAELEKALVALASNKRASPAAREAAVERLVEMEATKKSFAAIRKTLPAPLPEDSDQDHGALADLVEAVDRALE